MKFLILGSTSYLGRNILKKLQIQNTDFVSASRSDVGEGIQKHYNLSENFNLSRVVIENEISIIINCINSYYKNPSIKQVEEMKAINFKLPLSFINQILSLNHNIKFLNFGSYFNFIKAPKESVEYQKSKMLLSAEINSTRFNSNIKELVISDVFGEWDKRSKIFNIILKNLLKNKEINFTNPNNSVNLVYKEKLVDFVMDFVSNDKSTGSYLNKYSIKVCDLNNLLKNLLMKIDCNLMEHFSYEERFEIKNQYYGDSILNDISKVLENKKYIKFLVDS